MNPTISVIVPIYNSQQYISKCIDSILAQTFKDFELLLINDGSTDKSFDISQYYASIDSRIRVFNKSNGGVSSSRQFGIEHCKGVYTIHIDSDDWIDIDYLEKLYMEAIQTGADIVCAPFIKEYKNKSEKPSMYFTKDVDQYLKAVLTFKCWGNLWNKLILSDIFKKNNINFSQNISMWEDFLFLSKCLLYSRKISYCLNTHYHYVQYNTESLCSSIYNYNVLSHTTRAVIDLEKYYIKTNNYQKYKKEINISKLFAKQRLLFDPKYRNIKKWFSLFSESNRYIIYFFYYALNRRIRKRY